MAWRLLSMLVLTVGVLVTSPQESSAEWCHYSGCCDDKYYWCQSNCEDGANWCDLRCTDTYSYGSPEWESCQSNCNSQATQCAQQCSYAWNTCTEPE